MIKKKMTMSTQNFTWNPNREKTMVGNTVQNPLCK